MQETTIPFVNFETITLGGLGLPSPEDQTASGGIEPYMYLWSPAAQLNNAALANPEVTVTATGIYTVTVTDRANCIETDNVFIGMYDLPTADAGLNDTICYGFGDTIGGTPTATGPAAIDTVFWSPSVGLDNSRLWNPYASPLVTTVYQVTVIDINACRAIDSMRLNVLPERGIFTNDSAICLGDTFYLFAQGGTNYAWSPVTWLSASNVPDPTAIPDTDTSLIYTVAITSNFCSDTTDNVEMVVHPLPDITMAPKDTSVYQGEEIMLYASGGRLYSWSPPDYIVGDTEDSIIVVAPVEPSNFVVEVTNQYNCVNWDTLFIDVDTENNVVFVPSAFTPNNDNLNDMIYVKTLGIERFDFKVFNRWGELVFETDDPDIGWDGTYKGVVQHTQTFGWILKTWDYDGEVEKETGTITILK